MNTSFNGNNQDFTKRDYIYNSSYKRNYKGNRAEVHYI